MKIIFAMFLLCFSVFSHAVSLNKIVVFGDSLSDSGNLYEYMKHQLPISPPYYQGRFSNGPLWVDLLADYYYPGQGKAHMLNYAFGGAGVSEEEDDGDDEEALFTLRREVDSYLLAHLDKADKDSLYVVWMGSNNYLADPDDADRVVETVTTGIQHSLEQLAQKGAKHFLIVNLPNLGRAPAATDFDAVESLTYASNHHNEKLADVVSDIQLRYPDVQWLLFDVNLVFRELWEHPERNGLHNVTDTCYEEMINSTPSPTFILKMASSVKPRVSGDACTGYLFFDPVHPTEKAHSLMAEMIKSVMSDADIEFH